MSTINVRQAHALPLDQAKTALAGFEADLAQKGVKLVWSGHNAEIKGTGVSGGVRLTSNDVTVEVKLGMLAKAAGVKADLLQKSIEKRLASAFGSAS